jgi:hypothetical protein
MQTTIATRPTNTNSAACALLWHPQLLSLTNNAPDVLTVGFTEEWQHSPQTVSMYKHCAAVTAAKFGAVKTPSRSKSTPGYTTFLPVGCSLRVCSPAPAVVKGSSCQRHSSACEAKGSSHNVTAVLSLIRCPLLPKRGGCHNKSLQDRPH